MIALTGASGLVGRALTPLADLTLGKAPVGKPHRAFSLLSTAPDLSGVTTLVHAAFQHAPGRYRGGEGNDPRAFISANLHGTIRLFNAAAEHGVKRIIFLSSRAVFDGHPEGIDLPETLAPLPKSLYGQVKAEAEAHLFTLPLIGISLRATGLYGPGTGHKWTELFSDYLSGTPIAPRRATEVHFDDLRAAVSCLLRDPASGPAHLSDLLLDRHDLLGLVQSMTGCPHPLPERATNPVNVLQCERIKNLGWVPGGMEKLRSSLPLMLP